MHPWLDLASSAAAGTASALSTNVKSPTAAVMTGIASWIASGHTTALITPSAATARSALVNPAGSTPSDTAERTTSAAACAIPTRTIRSGRHGVGVGVIGSGAGSVMWPRGGSGGDVGVAPSRRCSPVLLPVDWNNSRHGFSRAGRTYHRTVGRLPAPVRCRPSHRCLPTSDSVPEAGIATWSLPHHLEAPGRRLAVRLVATGGDPISLCGRVAPMEGRRSARRGHRRVGRQAGLRSDV